MITINLTNFLKISYYKDQTITNNILESGKNLLKFTDTSKIPKYKENLLKRCQYCSYLNKKTIIIKC
jgi:hypothetical protein